MIEDYVTQAAALLGIDILPEHLPGVIRNFALLTEQAALFMDFPLDDRVEMAPTFRP